MSFVVTRQSPFAAAHRAAAARMVDVNGMQMPEAYPGPPSLAVTLTDLSHLPKWGVKGAGAASFLAAHELLTPAHHNRFVTVRDGLVARLGFTEFFMEASLSDDWTGELRRQERWPAQVVPVLRQDASVVLGGERVHELLLQVCSFDFESLQSQPDVCVMTQMLGVSILAIRTAATTPAYRLWFDPTFAGFMWATLLEIVKELGGGPLGLGDAAKLGMVRA